MREAMVYFCLLSGMALASGNPEVRLWSSGAPGSEGKTAKEVVLSDDPDRAAQIRHDDDAMDELHSHLFTVLMDREWKHGVSSAVDVTLLGRFYERFAEHAVQIGNRVVFQVTGEQVTEI